MESIGPTCDIATFILKYMDPGSELYRKTEKITNQLLTGFQDCENFGDMGISGFMGMIETLKELKYGDYDYDALWEKIKILVKNSIETDVSKWAYYGVRPSNYIIGRRAPAMRITKKSLKRSWTTWSRPCRRTVSGELHGLGLITMKNMQRNLPSVKTGGRRRPQWTSLCC